MLCATWNVNSLRARLPRVLGFLDEFRPDVLLLQETKCAPDQFPHGDLEGAGWTALDLSGGRWCGVAAVIPAGTEASKLGSGLEGEPNPDEARWLEVELPDGTVVVSVYAPNGREVDSVHYDHKLGFFTAAADRVRQLAEGRELIVAGDMNVAPRDIDVWDVTKFEGATHVTDAERTALLGMATAGGLTDAHDIANGSDSRQFTWWDYRGGSFHRDFGMRIDHFLVSAGIADRIESVGIAREYRKGEKPSDHVPVLMRLSD